MSDEREQVNSPDPVRGMGRGMLWIFWIGILAGGTWFFSGGEDRREHPNRNPESRVTDTFAEVRLESNRAGHYLADGYIDGQAVTFLLDTGATAVVIPGDVADRIGLARGQRIPVQTASGRDHAFLTRIDSLELGSISLRNVDGAIAPGLENTVLLGMSALSRMEMNQRDGILILTHRH